MFLAFFFFMGSLTADMNKARSLGIILCKQSLMWGWRPGTAYRYPWKNNKLAWQSNPFRFSQEKKIIFALPCETDVMTSETNKCPPTSLQTRAVARHNATHSKYQENHLQQLLVQVCLVEADVNRVPSGHHVVVVDHLEEIIIQMSRVWTVCLKHGQFSGRDQKPGIGLIFRRIFAILVKYHHFLKLSLCDTYLQERLDLGPLLNLLLGHLLGDLPRVPVDASDQGVAENCFWNVWKREVHDRNAQFKIRKPGWFHIHENLCNV